MVGMSNAPHIENPVHHQISADDEPVQSEPEHSIGSEPTPNHPAVIQRRKSPKTILFVDDEWVSMGSVRRLLPKARTDWDMRFANSGLEALGLLEERPATVIVKDLAMPEMDGFQLLAEVARRYPNAIRIVMSGRGDSAALLNPTGLTHEFLPKPCDLGLLFQTLDRSYYLRERVANPELRRLISRIRSLPSMPVLYTSLFEELNSDDPSTERIASIVTQDVAMCAKILHVVNLLGFGLAQRISSPAEAVAYLGTSAIKALVLSSLIFSHYSAFGGPGAPRFFADLWTHSNNTAL